MTETFKLTGDAVTGLVFGDAHLAEVSALSDEVCLGANLTSHAPVALRLEEFVNLTNIQIPRAVDYYSKAATSIARMYMNNRLGCCVFSGKFHNLGVWSANDPDSNGGQVVLGTDAEVQSQYFSVCGPGDNGCNIASVLNYFTRQGIQAGGKRYKIRGYCAFDWRSKELTQVAIAMGGALSIGFNLPGNWMNSAIWDTSNANRIVGGHDVSPIGYGPFDGTGPLPPDVRTAAVIQATAEGVIVSSWGRLYVITWAAWQSRNWITECYFMVPEFLWTGTDKQSPFPGVDLDKLLSAMDMIRGGNVPPLPEPPAPVDPTPLPPPVSGIDMAIPHGRLKVDYDALTLSVPKAYTVTKV